MAAALCKSAVNHASVDQQPNEKQADNEGERRYHNAMGDHRPRYEVGQLVYHVKAQYRGVIVQVDPIFKLSDDWYDSVAHSRPPRNAPWYRVLVHDADHETYVAERHLAPDSTGEPITHPHVGLFFDTFQYGKYLRRRLLN
jgi:heat shock protein HspQ